MIRKLIITCVFLPFLLVGQDIVINEVMSSNQTTITDEDGDTPDWIELYNSASTAVDLTGYALSDDSMDTQKWIFGSIIINPGEYLLVFASDKDTVTENLHANFKISASGEEILLSDSSSIVIDRVTLPVMMTDLSYARESDGQSPWTIQQPTPLAANGGSGFEGYADPVVTSHTDHFYSSAVSVELNAGDSEIYYTLDGTDPDESSTLYTGPINISNTTAIKARGFKENYIPGPILYHTYFIDENTALPLVSLVTDPDGIFGEENGIFEHYEEDWEREAHISFFEDDKQLGFSENVVINMYGGYTRRFNQKSMAVKFKSEQGINELNYPLFPGFDISTFKSFILRNSGNDFDFTHIRDAFMQTLVKDLDIDYLEYRPAVAYINGQYWGIYNIREKISEHYVANRHGVDKDNIDMMDGYKAYNQDGKWDGWMTVVHGDTVQYKQMIDYLYNNDLTTDEAYNTINQMIDVDECLLYYAAQVYFNSQDWPANNSKYWRERSENGKWRWVLYDLDFGFNLYEWQNEGNSENHVYYVFSGVETRPGSNPVESTFIIRHIVQNPRIKNQFVNQVADLLNTNFVTERVINIMTEMANHIADDIDRHRNRFDVNGENLDRMISFAQERPDNLRDHVRDFFDVGNDCRIYLDVAGAGEIKLNTLHLDQADLPWSGQYFYNNEVHIKAIPQAGYKFTGWSGTVSSQDVTLHLSGMRTIDLVANFAVDSSTANDIVINEINYHSSDLFDSGDWVEFYNRSSSDIDLSDWVFTDSQAEHMYNFPFGTILESGAYLVLVEDDSAFTTQFPAVSDFVSGMGFGLSGNGELIRLYDEDGLLIDSLIYDDVAPWPTAADGLGASLELIDPGLDNTLAENWQASDGNGTPGLKNSVISTVIESAEDKIPDKFLLFQNYPNPFNSTTKIRFQLDKKYIVSIKVFDVNGKIVRQVNGLNYDAGEYYYALEFSANLASGVYFYQVLLDNVVADTKKMLLIR